MTLIYRFIAIAALSGLALSAAAQTTKKPSGDILREGNVATSQPVAAPATVAVAARPAEIPASSTTDVPTLLKRPDQSNVLLPTGTAIWMTLDAAVSTKESKPGDIFSGKVSKDVVVDGKTVIPKGSTLSGRVMRLDQPRRIAGRPAIQLQPETVTFTDGKALPITAVIVDTGDPKHLHVNGEGRIKGPGMDQKDKIEMVAATGAGPIAGSIIKLGTGTWMGAAAGAAFTTGHWLLRRHSLELPEGTELIMEISNPVATPTQAQPSTAQGGN